MRLEVLRDVLAPTFTLGRFSVNGERKYDTVEPTVRGDGDAATVTDWKIPKISAIPYGEYAVTMRASPRFGCDVPILHDVPGFDDIEIHWGNTAADTDGCIIIGLQRQSGGVLNSRMACDDLYPQIVAAIGAGESVTIAINGGDA